LTTARNSAPDPPVTSGAGAITTEDRDFSDHAFHYKPGGSIGYLLRDCYRSFGRALETRIRHYGIGLGQWFFLRELWEEDGLTQSALSARTGVTAATTAVAIRRMVKEGLVTRRPDEQDGRMVRIRITPKTRRLRDTLLPFAAEVNADATRGFSRDEIGQLRDYIDRMKRNLSP